MGLRMVYLAVFVSIAIKTFDSLLSGAFHLMVYLHVVGEAPTQRPYQSDSWALMDKAER
ncbi:MAG: hypothetical protein NTW52_00540 [Planctomycetota bacterium]|nr:hypothetical protein [Planctomycetota bacterium]